MSGQPKGNPYQWIHFVGTGPTLATTVEVTVLAGISAPKVTGGWAKWAEVPRWGRTALTVIEGYDPRKMEVPILFDSLLTGQSREDIEENVQKLEWMAGRGTPPGVSTADAVGESPLVRVFANKIGSENAGLGSESPLIPIGIHNSGYPDAGNIHWLVTSIDFYDEPQSAGNLSPLATLRDQGGARLRQAATVTLLERTSYNFDAGAKARAEARAKLRHKLFEVKTTAGRNTIKKVAAYEFRRHKIPAPQQLEALGEIVAANNPPGRKPGLGYQTEKALKVNTPIRIPKSAVTRF